MRRLIAARDYKAALRGAKDFRLGVTKEQRSVMARGYEAILYADFYRQIGKNPDVCIREGIAVLQEVMG
ncbi:MAG: hypothetical protein LBC76_08230 [Treponema sp.]|nr:hypothetical protein [Treponema sp.]